MFKFKNITLLFVSFFLLSITLFAKPSGKLVFDGLGCQLYLQQQFLDTDGDGIIDLIRNKIFPVIWGSEKEPIVIDIPIGKISTPNATNEEIQAISQALSNANTNIIEAGLFLLDESKIQDKESLLKSNIFSTIQTNTSQKYKLITKLNSAQIVFIK